MGVIKCEKCGEDVEDNFDTCWNCQSVIVDNIKKELKDEKSGDFKKTLYVKVNPENIIKSGKLLKRIIHITIIVGLLSIFSGVILIADIRFAWIFLAFEGVIVALGSIIILFTLYEIADNLENSVKKNDIDNKL